MTQQPYVTEVARDIMNNTKYQGTSIHEIEDRLNLVDPRKEYEKKIKQGEKIQEEIEKFGMEHWDDYPKIIVALYKAVGIIPSTEKRVHNQIRDLDHNLENLTDITNDLQSEYERLQKGQYTSYEKKHTGGALMKVATKIKNILSDKIEDLEEQLKTAEINGEPPSEIIGDLADTRTDQRKAFNDETRYSMEVIRNDRAEREYARLTIDLQENLEGFNDRVLNTTLLGDELHIYVEHNGNALELWNVLKNNYEKGLKSSQLLEVVKRMNEVYKGIPTIRYDSDNNEEDPRVIAKTRTSKNVELANQILEQRT